MELSDFISSMLSEIASGLRKADESLHAQDFGGVWRSDFNTISSDLVNVRILKGKGPDKDKSVPVMVVDFEARVIAQESSEGTARGGLRISVVEAGGSKTRGKSDGKEHTIRFSVPLDISSTTKSH